jgi:hypothetical protein
MDDHDNPFHRKERKMYKDKVWKYLSLISVLFISIYYSIQGCTQVAPRHIEVNSSCFQEILTPRTLTNITGIETTHCLSNNESVYCHYTKQWIGPIDEKIRKRNAYFIDEYEDIYFVKNVVKYQENQIVMGDDVIKEAQLIRVLTQLREKEGERCICPSFVGIRDNMSFIYYPDTTEWIIMNEPVLGEKMPNARLVNTLIKYPENSIFKKYTQLSTKNEHYDSFSVSFNSPSFQFDSNDVRPLISYNQKILRHDTIEMKYTEQKQFILRRLDSEKDMKRITIKLKGEEAMCFIHCQQITNSL